MWHSEETAKLLNWPTDKREVGLFLLHEMTHAATGTIRHTRRFRAEWDVYTRRVFLAELTPKLWQHVLKDSKWNT